MGVTNNRPRLLEMVLYDSKYQYKYLKWYNALFYNALHLRARHDLFNPLFYKHLGVKIRGFIKRNQKMA